jgi:hypothetical protein
MVEEAIAQLEAGIGAMRALDVDALTDPEVEQVQVATIHGRVELLVVSARATRRRDASAAWASDGSKSAAARLARDVNWSLADARREIRTARALDTMPATAAALEAATIGPAHVELLAKANSGNRTDAFAAEEAWLVEQCRQHRFAAASKIVHYWCQRVDPEGCERIGRELLEKTSLKAATTLDDMVFLQGMLDPVGGAMFLEGLRRIERDLFSADTKAGVERSATARRAAALVEMAIRANTAPKDGKRPDPLVMILTGHESVARLCELSTGAVIAPNLIVPYLSGADVQGAVFADSRDLVRMSPQRTFTGWLRRAIQVRDRHCQHPAGCDDPIERCDVDHIVPDARGGPTTYDNGRLQCTTHNRNHRLHDRAPPVV